MRGATRHLAGWLGEKTNCRESAKELGGAVLRTTHWSGLLSPILHRILLTVF